MNLKISAVIRATVVIALALPLAGCGNKGPLVLPQSPPAEAEALPAIPSMDDASVPVEAVPEVGTPAAPPEDAASDDENDVPAPPPPPASDDGNG